MKKTERIFTPVESFRDLIGLVGSRPSRPLFLYTENGKPAEMDYATFYREVKREAAGFAAAGLAGKRIAVIGESSPDWIATYLAVVLSGGVIIPMDRELKPDQTVALLATVDADAMVCGKGYFEKFKDAPISTVISMEPSERTERTCSLADLRAMGDADTYEFAVRDPGALAVFLFTSGTTGSSKCVMLSEKNVCTTINAACETVEFFPDDTIVSVLPLHHTYEMACILAALDYGHTIGINDSLRHVLRNFAAYRPTGLVLVPLIVATMQKKIEGEIDKKGKRKAFEFARKLSRFLRTFGIDLRKKLFGDILAAFGGRLTKIVSGGARLDPALVRYFDDIGVEIAEGYGITECSPLVAVNPYYAPKPGSVGPAVPGCEVKIDKNGAEVDGHEIGEILVRGGNVMLGYYGNDAANAEVFTEDGWFRTGDIGYLDRDGYLFITGRQKSVIVLENGKNVFPEEMEEYLAKIPEIAESVVVGRTTADGTVRLTAILYPNAEFFPDTSREDVQKALEAKIQALNKTLPSFKVIRDVELRDEPFEKTTSHKIRRHLVK